MDKLVPVNDLSFRNVWPLTCFYVARKVKPRMRRIRLEEISHA